MDQPDLAAGLRALATSDDKRSKASRLRAVFEDVEAALAAGAKRTDVLAALEAHGLCMSLSTFETTLKRLRAKRAGSGTTSDATHRNVSRQHLAPSLAQTQHAKAGSAASYDPADLDRIITTQPDLVALAKLAKRKKQ